MDRCLFLTTLRFLHFFLPEYICCVLYCVYVDLLAIAPASESNERRLKAAVEDEQDEEDEEDDDKEPPISENVRLAGGIGSRGLGKS